MFNIIWLKINYFKVIYEKNNQFFIDLYELFFSLFAHKLDFIFILFYFICVKCEKNIDIIQIFLFLCYSLDSWWLGSVALFHQQHIKMTSTKSKEVADEYISSLSDLSFNSKPLINMLTMLAEDNIEHAPAIVQAVETHLQKVIYLL